MQHHVTVTMNNGREYEARDVDTTTLAELISAMDNPTAQTRMMPLEWTTDPGPQRRMKYHQVHVRAGHVSAVQAVPSFWVGVRAMFTQEGQVWEVLADALGTGQPGFDSLVRVEAVDGDSVLLSMVAAMDGNGLAQGEITLPVAAFVEVTSPASVDRLMDYGVALSPGDTIGRWPTHEEMLARLNS